jgi:hypothetical protein
MADGFIVVQPDSTGKKVDSTELTVGTNTVERQRLILTGSTALSILELLNSAPTGAEYAIPTRNIPSAPTSPVHSNATVTVSGSQIFTGLAGSGYSLSINIRSAPAGTAPSIQFSIQEVDEGDNTTPVGPTITGTPLTAVGTQVLTFNNLLTGSVRVSWTITGTTPSFTGVYSNLKVLTSSNPNLAAKTATINYNGSGDISSVVTVVGSQTRTDTFGYTSGNLTSITSTMS